MKKFMDEDFMLENPTAVKLFHEHSEKLPIIDYHCHLNPKEIYEDISYDNITQVWLYGDHYKWRQMRSNGVEEKYVTGDGSDFEKFSAYAATLEKAIGNPLYHWSHMELKKYFDFEGHLNADNAREVYDLAAEKLKSMSARKIILDSNVDTICTTDDPADSLEWHRKIKEDGFSVRVLPTWRPDKAKDIEKAGFTDYIKTLSEVSGVAIKDYASLMEALNKRLDFFVETGCKVSDHGLSCIAYTGCTPDGADVILKKRLAGEELTASEISDYQSAFMVDMAKACSKRGMAMQLHYSVQRDLNKKLFKKIGPDAGIDAIENIQSGLQMGQFLNAVEEDGGLPKTIIYSLNPADNAMIGTIIGCFQGPGTRGKIQHGSAWWFNDHNAGMRDQMISLANLGLLGNFIGMLTDSRSFLSYTRHDYFRRIMCNLIGEWVEKGEYPDDMKALSAITEGISYYNAKEYFGF